MLICTVEGQTALVQERNPFTVQRQNMEDNKSGKPKENEAAVSVGVSYVKAFERALEPAFNELGPTNDVIPPVEKLLQQVFRSSACRKTSFLS